MHATHGVESQKNPFGVLPQIYYVRKLPRRKYAHITYQGWVDTGIVTWNPAMTTAIPLKLFNFGVGPGG